MPAIPPKTGAVFKEGLWGWGCEWARQEGREEGRGHERDEVSVAFGLFHGNSDLCFNLGVVPFSSGDAVTDLQSAIDFTFLHEISPRNPFFSIIVSFHKFGEVQLDVSKDNGFSSSTRRVLLEDLKMHL